MCDVLDNITDVNIVDHRTASESIVIICLHKKLRKKIVLKCYYNSLMLEAEKDIIFKLKKLFKQNHHIPQYLFYKECDYTYFIDNVSYKSLKRKITVSNVQRIDTKNFSETNPKIRMFAYEYMEGDILKNEIVHMNDDSLRKVLFGVLYTLFLFDKHSIMHNDLHLGNVMLIKNKANSLYTYDGFYQFSTTMCPVIYDYDQSNILSAKKSVINPFTKKGGWLCDRHDICDKFIKHKDIRTFLTNVHNITKNTTKFRLTNVYINEIQKKEIDVNILHHMYFKNAFSRSSR